MRMSVKCAEIAAVHLKENTHHKHIYKPDVVQNIFFRNPVLLLFSAVPDGFISPGEVQDVLWEGQLQSTKHAAAEAS